MTTLLTKLLTDLWPRRTLEEGGLLEMKMESSLAVAVTAAAEFICATHSSPLLLPPPGKLNSVEWPL